MELFRVLAGILHMGNVQFLEQDGETCCIEVSAHKVALSTLPLPPLTPHPHRMCDVTRKMDFFERDFMSSRPYGVTSASLSWRTPPWLADTHPPGWLPPHMTDSWGAWPLR